MKDVLYILFAYGADLNHKDKYSQSPLLKSIRGYEATTRFLLDYGVDTESQDEYGNTPVLEAICWNKTKAVTDATSSIVQTLIDFFELKPGHRARDGQISLLEFVVWY